VRVDCVVSPAYKYIPGNDSPTDMQMQTRILHFEYRAKCTGPSGPPPKVQQAIMREKNSVRCLKNIDVDPVVCRANGDDAYGTILPFVIQIPSTLPTY